MKILDTFMHVHQQSTYPRVVTEVLCCRASARATAPAVRTLLCRILVLVAQEHERLSSDRTVATALRVLQYSRHQYYNIR